MCDRYFYVTFHVPGSYERHVFIVTDPSKDGYKGIVTGNVTLTIPAVDNRNKWEDRSKRPSVTLTRSKVNPENFKIFFHSDDFQHDIAMQNEFTFISEYDPIFPSVFTKFSDFLQNDPAAAKHLSAESHLSR